MSDIVHEGSVDRQNYCKIKRRIDDLCRMDRDARQNAELNQLWEIARDYEDREYEMYREYCEATRGFLAKNFHAESAATRWSGKPDR